MDITEALSSAEINADQQQQQQQYQQEQEAQLNIEIPDTGDSAYASSSSDTSGEWNTSGSWTDGGTSEEESEEEEFEEEESEEVRAAFKELQRSLARYHTDPEVMSMSQAAVYSLACKTIRKIMRDEALQ